MIATSVIEAMKKLYEKEKLTDAILKVMLSQGKISVQEYDYITGKEDE